MMRIHNQTISNGIWYNSFLNSSLPGKLGRIFLFLFLLKLILRVFKIHVKIWCGGVGEAWKNNTDWNGGDGEGRTI